MPTSEQLARLANVMGWIRTAKESLPAINCDRHGRNAVAPEQIARVSGLLDRMHKCALDVAAATGAATAPDEKKVPAKPRSRRAA